MALDSSISSYLASALILFISSLISSQGQGSGAGDIIRDGQTLVSESGTFVLGFFDSNQNGNSSVSRYLGIWYNFSTDVIVWVANRENPVTHSFGVFELTEDGDLIISQNQSNNKDIVWSSNSSNPKVVNPVAKLLDSGNLIVTNVTEDGDLIWQSFDHPTDTLLPGMKLGFNRQTDLEWKLSTWKQPFNSSLGELLLQIETTGLHESYLFSDRKKLERMGSWNGRWFVGAPTMKTNPTILSTFVDNQTEVFYSFSMNNAYSYGRMTLYPNRTTTRAFKQNNTSEWVYFIDKFDTCNSYNYCGPNGLCNPQNLTYCQCFVGFRPKSAVDWRNRDFSMGCERDEVLNCTDDQGFLEVGYVKIPESTNSTLFDKNMSMTECKDRCFSNCSCMAYAPVYLESFKVPRGCIMWDGDLVDTVLQNSDDGLELYLRVPKSLLLKNSSRGGRKTVIIVTVVVGIAVILLLGIIFLIRKKKKKRIQIKGTSIINSITKDNKKLSGPLKPGVNSVESTVKAVVGPVYVKYHDVPYVLLKLFDRKVGDSVSELDRYVPAAMKSASTQACAVAQKTPEMARSVATEVQRAGVVGTATSLAKVAITKCEPSAKELYSKCEPVAEQYAVSGWRTLNKFPLFSKAAQVVLPTAAYCSERYNGAVLAGREKGYTVADYLMPVPTEKIAQVFGDHQTVMPAQ